MSNLREQLQAARATYHANQYPGDLADLLPAPASAWSRWRLPTSATAGLAAAAAVIFLLSAVALQSAGHGSSSSRWQAFLPTTKDIPQLPRRGQMAGAIQTLTPPEVPEILMDAKQPLVSSGQFILNIGRDIAHHADALFHMG